MAPADLPLRSISDVQAQRFDCIIVGAGVAGSALAAGLAKSGRSVLLVERSFVAPDRIVGELLQPRGVLALQQLGLQDCLNGIEARTCRGYTVFWGDKDVNIPYPPASAALDALEDDAAPGMRNKGVQEGRSFHHGSFVQSLRRAAAREQRVALFEAAVTDLVRCDGAGRIIGVRVSPTQQTRELDHAGSRQEGHIDLLAPLVFFVDGCFSKFRRIILPHAAKPIVRSHFVALLLKDADLPDVGHGHVFLPRRDADAPTEGEADDAIGPVLVYQLDRRETRMLIDVPGEKAPPLSAGALEARLTKHVLPVLSPRLVPAFQEALQASADSSGSGRLRSMPNSWLPPHDQHTLPAVEGCIVAGDALSMRHPLTGGGMTVALTDVALLVAELGGPVRFGAMPVKVSADVVDLQDWSAVAVRTRRWYSNRKETASTINVLAQALYRLFGASDDDLEVLKRGCFAYFELGGDCIQGPVSLLSALSPSRFKLFRHFFAVALYSIWLLFKPSGSSKASSAAQWPHLVKQSFSVFATACVVFLPVLWQEF